MPELIAGYEIAAVQTTANTDCLDDGVTHVTLIRRPGFVELDNQVTPEIIAAFQAINPQTTWSFDFVDRDNLYRLLGDTGLGERMRTVVCRAPMGGGPPDISQATPATPPRTDPLVTRP